MRWYGAEYSNGIFIGWIVRAVWLLLLECAAGLAHRTWLAGQMKVRAAVWSESKSAVRAHFSTNDFNLARA